ncbi:hypothetical protein ACVDG5_018010 [Mesorhizobium sp. ORM6]
MRIGSLMGSLAAFAVGSMSATFSGADFRAVEKREGSAPLIYRRNHHRKIHRSKYWPHQGKQECARRLRQGCHLRNQAIG